MTASARCIFALATTLVLALGAGCGQESPESAPPPMPEAKDLPYPDPGARAELPLAGGTEMPANFPADVPRYPGALVALARGSADGGLALRLSIEEGVEEVASFYADSFAAEGWSTDIRETNQGSAIIADKGNRKAAVMVNETEGGTEVDLIVATLPQ